MVQTAITLRLAGLALFVSVPLLLGPILAPHARATASQATDSGQQCGMVSVLFDRLMMISQAQTAEDCFYQAYLQCAAATLGFRRSFGDAVMLHTFTIQSDEAGCVILDAQQMGIFPRPLGPVTNVTCANLAWTPAGLLVSACSSGDDILVPSS